MSETEKVRFATPRYGPLRRCLLTGEQILRRCREYPTSISDPGLGEIIVKEAKLDFIHGQLDRLNPSLIPTGFDPYVPEDSADALIDVANLVALLRVNIGHPGARFYREQYHSLLAERWRDVTAWMVFILVVAVYVTHGLKEYPPNIIRPFAGLLNNIGKGAANGDRYLEEMATSKATMHLVFELLCMREKGACREICPTVNWPMAEGRSAQAALLATYTSVTVCLRAFKGYLTSTSKRRRDFIISALGCLAERAVCPQPGVEVEADLAKSAKLQDLADLLQALARLMADGMLRKSVIRTGCLHRYISAISIASEGLNSGPGNRFEDPISSGACWMMIASGILILTGCVMGEENSETGSLTPSSKIIAELVHNELYFVCVRRCLLVNKPMATGLIPKALDIIIPYLYIPRVFNAIPVSNGISE